MAERSPGAPGAILVIFDDGCGVCRACVRWSARLLRRAPISYVPARGLVPSDLPPGVTPASLATALHVVTPAAQVRAGWDAVTFLARQSYVTWLVGAAGSVWPLAAVGRWAYAAFAARRRRGGGGPCERCGAAGSASGRPARASTT
jgi:predicted DCC family thiol-disulfide oxidoreductase YuxK